MIVDIEKIIVKDRIRKDFGDIKELADDIKQNGLINPPVVNKEYELLAGERRLRACKLLGWSQIEVRMMDTRNEEHDFDVEVSENENRKDFSRTEREAIYTRRVERKMKSEPNLARIPIEKEIAKDMGTSRTNMQAERVILNNRNLLDPSDFAEWDEGKLSTNKAFQKVKAKQKEIEAENNRLRSALSESETRRIQAEQSTKEVVKEVVKEVEVIPNDYDELKEKASKADVYKSKVERLERQRANNTAYNELMAKYTKKCNEALELQDQIAELKNVTQEGLENKNLSENVFYFCTLANNFVGNVGGLVWLTERIGDMPKHEKELFLKASQALRDFSLVFTQNLEKVGVEYGRQYERTNSTVSLLTNQSECGQD